MAQVIIEGGKFQFTVVGKTASGKVIALTDATITLDNAALMGTLSVGADGSNGVFQSEVGKLGTGNLVARAAGVNSAPFPIEVDADTIVTTVEIQPVVVSVEPV